MEKRKGFDPLEVYLLLRSEAQRASCMRTYYMLLSRCGVKREPVHGFVA